MIQYKGLGAGCHNTSPTDLPNLADVRLTDSEEHASLLRRANQVKVTIVAIQATLKDADMCSHSRMAREQCAGCQQGKHNVADDTARLEASLTAYQTWLETAQVLLNPPPN